MMLKSSGILNIIYFKVSKIKSISNYLQLLWIAQLVHTDNGNNVLGAIFSTVIEHICFRNLLLYVCLLSH